MKPYHKIQSIYYRDPATKNKTLLEGQYSRPEFESLKDNLWEATEKIDGTNTRIMWDGTNVRFGGRTDNSQIQATLISYLQNTFTPELMKTTFPELTSICLYGEGFGNKLQKYGHRYLPEKNAFILFDVNIDDRWLERKDILDIADKLGIDSVPIVGYFTLDDAVELVKKGFTSKVAYDKDYIAEGLILRPQTMLFDRSGRKIITERRIITKIKHKDFLKI